MTYRFVKISNYYNDLLRSYYQNNPELINFSYQQQYDHFMKQDFGWSDYFKIHLNNIGVEAYEIIGNGSQMQKAWAKEHGFEYNNELIIQQLKIYNPDVLLVHDFNMLTPAYIRRLKNELPNLKQLIGYCCSPFSKDNLEVFRCYNYILTCSPLFAGIFEENNIKCYLFPHGFESSLAEKVSKTDSSKETDFIFIGSFIQSSDYHDERIKIIESLIKEKIELQIYSNIKDEKNANLILRQVDYMIAQILKKLKLQSIGQNIQLINKAMTLNAMPKKSRFSNTFLSKVIKQPLYGLQMLNAIAGAKIGFNIHGGIAGNYAANIRMFEVTGAGTLLLTDHKKNIRDFFEPDYEIITYSSFEECIEKVRWLLNNPDKTNAISKAGQLRCLKDHSIKNRVELLHEIIKGNF